MKEVIGRDLHLFGEVLPRANDYEGVEDRQDPSYDAELMGYAMRVGRTRNQSLTQKNNETTQEPEVASDDNTGAESFIPRDVMDRLIDAAIKEDECRSKGYAQSRIDSLVGRPLAHDLIKMEISGIDTSNALAISQHDVEDNLRDIDTEREARIEKLVDQGMTYDDARRMA